MPETPARAKPLFERFEVGICLAATALATWLHARFLGSAGALWRDEAGGVQLAGLPSWSEVWRMLSHDSSPVLFPALVRTWSGLGLATTDYHLRILGTGIGLSLLGALWLNARLVGARAPVISLGLLGANLALVRWGDSLRAYGCGCLLNVLTLGLVWRLTQKPGRGAFALAALAATLSVQALYQNGFLVLAACGAGAVVCARRRQWSTTTLVLSVGLVAALSLLPYLPAIRESQITAPIQQVGFQPRLVWPKLWFALGATKSWPGWVWIALCLLSLALGAGSLRAAFPKVVAGAPSNSDLTLFAATALLTALVGFCAFLYLAALPTEPWYFLPLMSFVAAALDAGLGRWCRQWRIGPMLFVSAMFGLLFPASFQSVKSRQTNIDLVAAELGRRSGTGDLVVIFSCHCGITFGRYFKGPAAWTTLPPLEDYRLHRFDLVKAKLSAKSPLAPVLKQAAKVLASGHTLWLVGKLPLFPPGAGEPEELPPAPRLNEPLGWWEGAYDRAWTRQMSFWVQRHSQRLRAIPIESPVPVSPYEDVSLTKAAGWVPETLPVPTSP